VGLNAAVFCPLPGKAVSGINDGFMADWTGRESGLMLVILSSAENVVDGTGLVKASFVFVEEEEEEEEDDDGRTAV